MDTIARLGVPVGRMRMKTGTDNAFGPHCGLAELLVADVAGFLNKYS